MALSSAQNNDLLKSNRITSYTLGTNNEFSSYNQLSSKMNTKRQKITPKQCKPSCKTLLITDNFDTKMKKSSSLHNIEKLNEDQQYNSSQNINKKNSINDKQQINLNSELLSRIEREKKQYEAKISVLIQKLETRKKDKELLIYDKKNLTEALKLLEKEFKHIKNENIYLRLKMKEIGIEMEYHNDKQDDKSDPINLSVDTVFDGYSLTHATLGDSSSLCDHLSEGSPENPSILDEYPFFTQNNSDREILDSLSVSTLQERIQKMEEASYCTNEELQATMQELVDLQNNLDSLNEDNHRLADHRAILLDSLNEQTHKLDKCHLQIKCLKDLLLNTVPKDSSSELLELYRISEDRNRELVIENEECKHTIISCQNEYKELSSAIEYLREELSIQLEHCSHLEESHKEELWQREQIESLLKNHHELFRDCDGWLDCSSGVLALIQSVKSARQTEQAMQNNIDQRSSEIRQLKQALAELERTSRSGDAVSSQSIEQLQAQLRDSEKEVRLLTDNVNTLAKNYADDMVGWREYECDLLVAVAVANGLKEEKERELQELALELAGRPAATSGDKSDVLVTARGGKGRVLASIDRTSSACGVNNGTTGKPIVTAINKSRTGLDKNTSVGITKTISNNSSVKSLIQSIEDQVKSGSCSTPKEPSISVHKPHTHSSNTVPRTSLSSQPEKHEIIRISPTVSSRLGDDSSTVIRRNSELSKTKAACENLKKLQIGQQQLSENSVSTDTPPPLVAIATPATTILQSVSRRSSVTTLVPPGPDHPLYSSAVTTATTSSAVGASNNSIDYLSQLVKRTNKGSKRNALLYWCQTKTAGYQKIEITNFSSSWNDGLALCALFHACDNSLVDFKSLADGTPSNPDKTHKRINFQKAFDAAEKIGITTQLDIESMIIERPDWNAIMNYVSEIYQHFDTADSH